MAVLPRAEFEALSETAEHSGAMTQYLSGGLTGLTPEETRAYVAAASASRILAQEAGLFPDEPRRRNWALPRTMSRTSRTASDPALSSSG